MNNIFTFDADDKQQDQQYNCNQQQSKQNSDLKQYLANKEIFTFEDFEQESFQNHQSQQNSTKKQRLSQISQNSLNIGNQDKKNQTCNQLRVISGNQSNFKKKTVKQMVPGLEIEDLGIKDMEYVQEKKALKVTDMRKFLHNPLGDYKVKALIRKEEGNFLNLNVKYNVYIEQNNRYLFTVSRQGISQYIFSLQKSNSSEKKKSYLGKMIANMAGTEFLLFDSGFSPSETRSLESCRKQFASIKYSAGSGPRRFTTIISTNCQGFYCLQTDHNILQQKWQKKQRQYLSIMYSRAPELDPEDGNYKLDFKGIVKKASVKNFILGGVQWDDSLIFGKIDNNTFIMEIKEPLSVFQAAAISVSSIHYKLNWK